MAITTDALLLDHINVALLLDVLLLGHNFACDALVLSPDVSLDALLLGRNGALNPLTILLGFYAFIPGRNIPLDALRI